MLVLQELRFWDKIDWVDGRKPLDEPECGFDGQLCTEPPIEWVFALCGTLVGIASIIVLAVYRNWVYERELDSLLWRIDFKDVILHNNNQAAMHSLNKANPPKVRLWRLPS